jgi:hypothetical protein
VSERIERMRADADKAEGRRYSHDPGEGLRAHVEETGRPRAEDFRDAAEQQGARLHQLRGPGIECQAPVASVVVTMLDALGRSAMAAPPGTAERDLWMALHDITRIIQLLGDAEPDRQTEAALRDMSAIVHGVLNRPERPSKTFDAGAGHSSD